MDVVAAPGLRVELGDDVMALWLTGAHDATTVRPLRITLEHVVAFDERDLEVDRSDATVGDDTLIAEQLEAKR